MQKKLRIALPFALALIAAGVGISFAHAQTVTAPTALDGSYTVDENASVTGTLTANDTNSPALPLTYAIVSYPSDGVLSNLSNSTGTFTYTPDNNFVGQDSFTFMVNNGTANSATATETMWVGTSSSSTASSTSGTSTSTSTSTPSSTITITAPIASGGTLNVTENSSATGTLMASDTNSPALPLTYSIVSYPVNGTLSGMSTSSGSFMYTPNTDFVGNDPFTFKVNNGTDDSAAVTEMVVVNAATSTTSTSSASSTQLVALENQIQQLEQEILSLIQQVLGKVGGSTGSTGTGGTGTATATVGTPTIGPQNATVRAGTSMDFEGRNFAPNEPVTVSLNGQTVTTAQADGGGNFSTGSLPVSSNASGTLTYTFTGQNSGTVLTGTITVTP